MAVQSKLWYNYIFRWLQQTCVNPYTRIPLSRDAGLCTVGPAIILVYAWYSGKWKQPIIHCAMHTAFLSISVGWIYGCKSQRTQQSMHCYILVEYPHQPTAFLLVLNKLWASTRWLLKVKLIFTKPSHLITLSTILLHK